MAMGGVGDSLIVCIRTPLMTLGISGGLRDLEGYLNIKASRDKRIHFEVNPQRPGGEGLPKL